MDAATPTPPDQWRPKKPSLAERHGGALISVAFHIAFFALLNNYAIRGSPAPPFEPRPIVIDLFQEEPQQAGAAAEEPEAELETAAAGEEPLSPEEPPPTFEEVVATVAEDALDEEGLQAVAPEEAPEFSPPEPTEQLEPEPEEPVEPEAEESEPQEPAPEETESIGDDSEPPPPEPDEKRERELRKLAELKRNQSLAAADPTVERQESGSTRIDERLQAAAVQLKAKKWQATTAGLDKGVIRSFDFEGHPKHVVEEVKARYEMEEFYGYLRASGGGHNFINQIRTSKGIYTNQDTRQVAEGPGFIFSIKNRSIPHLVRLEDEAMRRRGFDPSTYRKVEVVFGIVSTTGGYDLGVIRLEVAPVDLNPDP